MDIRDKKFYVISSGYKGVEIYEAVVTDETPKTFTISYGNVVRVSYKMPKHKVLVMPFFRTDTTLITDNLPNGIVEWNAKLDKQIDKLKNMRIKEE